MNQRISFLRYSLLFGLCFLVSNTHAANRRWNASNGTFGTGANWVGGIAPGPADVAQFGRSNPPPDFGLTYTVSFTVNATNQALHIEDDTVTFDLNGNLYSVTLSNGILIGNQPGSYPGKLTITDGNVGSAANIDVGAATGATGELVIGAGGVLGGSPSINVGKLGTGTLNVISGGDITSTGTTSIGLTAGISGNALITSSGSTLVTNTFNVGLAGTGSVQVSAGGLVESTTAVVGSGDLFTGIGNGTVNVSNAGSLWRSLGLLTVGDSGTGVVNITSGGTLSGNNNLVGGITGGSGQVNISGSGSAWNNTGTVTIGGLGAGTLNVQSQGVVQNTSGVIGASALGPLRGNGIVIVTGTGSQWINSQGLIVGNSGIGTLNINSGGHVSNVAGVIGANATGEGSVSVNGANSHWTNSGSLTVGDLGDGNLNITGGGLVTNGGGATIGLNSGGMGVANVAGIGSTWNDLGTLTVGHAGHGTLGITDGGRVNNTSAIIGFNAGSQGTVTVTKAGSLWDNSAFLIVGNNGVGTLNITEGGHVKNGLGGITSLLGGAANGSGHVVVDGSNSIWEVGTLKVGDFGAGNLEIRNGGSVSSVDVSIGASADSTGMVTIRDNGSLWDSSGSLTVGDSGDATVFVLDGGRVNSAGGVIAQEGSSLSEVIISGPNSLWDNSGLLTVGNNGAGVLRIEASGRVDNTSAVLGKQQFRRGTVTVTGVGSQWVNSSVLTVGSEGVGNLFILDGGHVESHGGSLGKVEGSSGRVEVRGANSEWIVDDAFLAVGDFGFGRLEISEGGRVQSGNVRIGNGGPDAEGRVYVEGLGSTWNTESLDILAGSRGASLTVDAGAIVNISDTLHIVSSAAEMNLNGGEINVASIVGTSNTTIAFNSGTFRFTGDYLIDDEVLDFVLGEGYTIGPLQHFAVAGKPTMETSLILNGGTFSAGSLVHGSPLFFNSGTFNLTSDNFTVGAAGLFGDTLALSNRNVNITNTATIQSGARLQLQGGAFSAGTLVNQGTIDFQNASSQVSGGLLTNTGTIRGSGSILNAIQNNTAGQIQSTVGQRLEFGGAVTNSGTVSLVGGQMQFNSSVVNSASTGLISARDGVVRFVSGLTNNGSVAVSIGATDFFGDITNSASGRIIVSGGGQATFYDDVINGGSINVSAAGPVASTAIFLGSLSGNGVAGGGQILLEGDARPGFSAGNMSFGGDVTLGPAVSLEIELGGIVPGSLHDRIQVAGDFNLDGSLVVSLINGFAPTAGQSFDILDWGGITGVFSSINLPLLSGLAWNTSELYTDGVLSLVSAPVNGDFDLDGDVDGRDFLIWQRGGSPTPLSNMDLADWQSSYGAPLVAAAEAASPVPEPGSLFFINFAVVVFAIRRHFTKRN